MGSAEGKAGNQARRPSSNAMIRLSCSSHGRYDYSQQSKRKLIVIGICKEFLAKEMPDGERGRE